MRHITDKGTYSQTISGNLTVIGVLSSTTPIRERGMYGGIYVDDGSTTQVIPTGTTYTKLSAFTTNGGSSNVTADAANDKLTITIPANYLVNCAISFSGTISSDWKMAAFYNGTEMPNIHCARKLGTGGDVGSASMMGILSAGVVGDLDVRVRHTDGGNQNIVVQYANLTVVYIGDI